jgi:2-C-methyl-D-erythritol 4-phosphate cytidylyltransferase
VNIAIVLAGGVGTRVGAGIPKQFIEVLGKPIMIYTLETFEKDPFIDEIVFVCVESHMDLAKEYCKKYGISKVRTFTNGGEDFTHSCINGMNALRGKCRPDDIVVVTSADRPFISMEEIEDSIAVCREHGSGIAARKCALCMFMVGEDRTHSRNYQRDNLVQTATPWTFQYGPLLVALDRFEAGELPPCESYPPAIYVAAGNEAYFSLAKPGNIKITEKADVALMEQMLKERENV